MAEEKEAFLSRWSRRKLEGDTRREEPAPPADPRRETPDAVRAEEPAPPLQPVEELTPESDFAPFMNARVPAETRAAALKQLFRDPRFNVPDLNEAYSGDWTGGEPIPLAMLKTLNQAQKILFDEPAQPGVRDESAPGSQRPGAEQAAASGDIQAAAPVAETAAPAADADTAVQAETRKADGLAGKDA